MSNVVFGRLSVGEGGFPIPLTLRATKTLQHPEHVTVVVDDSGYLAETVVINDEVEALCRNTGHSIIQPGTREASRTATKRVIRVVGTHNEFDRTEWTRCMTNQIGLRFVIRQLGKALRSVR